MNLKQKLYQMFILGCDGNGYKKALKNGLGGIIFFTKDIQSPEQFRSLIDEIKSEALIPPFLSIDQEACGFHLQGRYGICSLKRDFKRANTRDCTGIKKLWYKSKFCSLY